MDGIRLSKMKVENESLGQKDYGPRQIPHYDVSDQQKALHRARKSFQNGNFNEAFDIYDQLALTYPEKAIVILAEVYDKYQLIPERDRYLCYQSRFFNFGIKPTDKVLDIGSGNIPFRLATHLVDITIDDDDYGRGGVPFKHIEGKPVFECNIENLPFKDKEFDFVYCSHVLEHVVNPERACNELMRVAKHGYIETPTPSKDLWLNNAEVSHHRWAVENINGKLVFTEYSKEEIDGLQHNILRRITTDPQTPREKALSALMHLKANVLNTMLLWEGSFEFEQPCNTKTLLSERQSSSSNDSTSKIGSEEITWEQVGRMPVIRLYAGDVPKQKEYEGLIGLSLSRNDQNHLRHDITQPFPLMDNSVDSFQAEDVLEHIPYEKLVPVINEIYRVLKPDGLFRLSVPDYGCDVLQNRSIKDEKGQIVFDPGGGGTPENPGHVWFPRIDTVMQLLTKTKFHESGKIELLHYYNKDGTFVAKPIDYSKGHIMRTPDFDQRVKNPYRPMSLVIDLAKDGEMLREKRNKSRHPEALVGMQEQSVVKTEPADPVEKCKQTHILMEQGHILKALDRFDKILAPIQA